MKIYISYDMEGLTGVHHSDHVAAGRTEYSVFQRIGMEELNAAIEVAFEEGATSVVVNENHWTMKNILIEDIYPKAEYISGWNKRNLAMAGLDSSFDAAFLIGYHAMAGTEKGVLSHTLLGRQIHNVWLNGERVGEIAMSSALAGHYDVPIALVTGDRATTNEAQELLKNVEAGTVFKKATPVDWVCLECGYVHNGTEPPEECPSCGHDRGYYAVLCEKY